jgi:glutamate---cysteine ligase / carboxylate-amine ligase
VTVRTVGVEEEFLLVDADSGAPRAVAHLALARDGDSELLTGELQREQVETATRPCATLDELGAELRRARATAARAAAAAGSALAALGTSPVAVAPTLSSNDRYQRMARRFGLTAAEELTCGCHVHVAVDSDDEGVGALDRIRPWLAPLLALTANSPYWQGHDSGYASYRSQVWSRWPSAGPYVAFGSAAGYHDTVRAMVDTDTVLDRGMIYFDARLSAQHPTLEVRVADVCLDVDDAVLLAALARALVETGVRAWRADVPPDPVRLELLRLAAWRASRSGVDGPLLDPGSWRPAPTAEVVERLVGHVTPALEDAGDLATVRELLPAVLGRGTGARAQREAAQGATARQADAGARAAVALAVRRTTG